MRKLQKKLFVIVMMLISTTSLFAQSACDKLYQQGLSQQKVMTEASQNTAIATLKRAKACYDSAADKKKCDRQIAVCQANIKKIHGGSDPKPKPGPKKNTKKEEAVDSVVMTPVTVEKEPDPVKIGFSETLVKFKAKGGEFKKVSVNCNYSDWYLAGYPDWLNVSLNDDKDIVIESKKNKAKEERVGSITVICRGTSVSFNVFQEKKGLLNIKL